MSEVWQLTLSEFLNGCPVCDYTAKEFQTIEREHEEQVEEVAEAWLKSTLRKARGSEIYWFADIRGKPRDVALLERDEVTGEFTVVGGYIDCYLWINRLTRGKKLGAELVLAKAEKVEGPIEAVSYTLSGYKATAWAHYLAVKRAVEQGLRVPFKVLLDYPEFSFESKDHGDKKVRTGPHLQVEVLSGEKSRTVIQQRMIDLED